MSTVQEIAAIGGLAVKGVMPRSIRGQLALLVVIAAAPMALLLAVEYADDVRTRLDFAESASRAAAFSAASTLTYTLAEEAEVLAHVAKHSPALERSRPVERCEPFLLQLNAARESVSNYLVLARNGDVLCAATPDPSVVPRNVGDRPHFQRMLRTGAVEVGEPFLGWVSKRRMVPVAYPWRGSDGAIVGAIESYLSAAQLERTVRDAAQLLDGVVLVLARDDRVIASSVDRWVGRSVEGPLKSALSAADVFFTVSDFEGTERVWHLANVPVAGWKVLAGVDRGRLILLVAAELLRQALWVLAAIAALIATSMAVARWITRPVQDLADVARAVATGNATRRAVPGGALEIAAVAREFNAMLDERDKAADALRASAERLSLAMRASRVAMWDFDVPSQRIYLSSEWADMLGVAPEETVVSDAELIQLVPEPQRAMVLDAVARVVGGERNEYTIAHQVRKPDGDWLWIQSRGTAVARDLAGRATRLIGTNADITERKRDEQALRETTEQLSRVIETMSEGLLVIDAGGQYRLVNAAAEEITGAKRDRILGRRYDQPPWKRRREGEELPLALHPYERLRAGEDSIRDYLLEIEASDGRSRTVSVNAAAAKDEEGRFAGMVATMLDVTDREQALARIRQKAYFDDLTGLPNINRFLHSLRLAVTSPRARFAVVVLSVLHFARINESLGRAEADMLLQRIAQRLRERLADALELARLDGARFGLLLDGPGTPEEASSAVRARLERIFAQPIAIGEIELLLDFRAGIALYPTEDMDEGADLMQHATSAYEQAKRSGVPVHAFGPELLIAARERLRIEGELRGALARGEFELHYQPRVLADSGEICGLEALLRWRHPQRGLVGPGVFVPALEESGLIVAAGTFAIREALGQRARWLRAGIAAPRIAVNVSTLQLEQPDFVDTVLELVRGLDDPGLDLEITESLMMGDLERKAAQLRTLRQAGIRISVDDFGTGYSSLAYLARLPLDTLKIDRAFVSDISERADHLAIARSIVSLAHALDLNVCAEGVETEAQRAVLASLRCNEMQGFLFARPMAAHEVDKLLRTGQ